MKAFLRGVYSLMIYIVLEHREGCSQKERGKVEHVFQQSRRQTKDLGKGRRRKKKQTRFKLQKSKIKCDSN